MKKQMCRKALFSPDELQEKLVRHQEIDYETKHSDVDPRVLALCRDSSVAALSKKYIKRGSDKHGRRARAFRLFRDTQVALRGFPTPLDISTLQASQKIEKYEKVMWRARNLCHLILGDFDYDEWFTGCKHSDGASIGVRYGATSLSDKMVLPMSSTTRAAEHFEWYLRWDPLLVKVLELENPEKNFRSLGIFPYLDIVSNTTLTTVPKTASIDRSICPEPTVNMFLQKGIERMICNRLIPFGVDISKQQYKHHELAWFGSLTNKLSTIDFSSASDCVSIELLRFLLPPQWFKIVDDVRTPLTMVDGELIKLNCIATMGNATTFPLETLTFFCLAAACVSLKDSSRSLFVTYEDYENVSVFGDDCILPTFAAADFIQICKSVGFIVNDDKSYFGQEFFRESCGCDYFHGRNIRPFYLKAPESSRPSELRSWLYRCYNGIKKKAIVAFGPLNYIYRSSALQFLASCISAYNERVFFVPEHFPDSCGIQFTDIREKLLFDQTKLSKISVDRHGTYYFRMLVPSTINGTKRSRPIHFWWMAKTSFSSISRPLDFLDPPIQKVRVDFESSRREFVRYVVSRCTDCTSALEKLV